MTPNGTFPVTMVRPGPVPSFEFGAYEYEGASLPRVGETILLRSVVRGTQAYGFVTRVNAESENPIAVTEAPPSSSAPDDYLAA